MPKPSARALPDGQIKISNSRANVSSLQSAYFRHPSVHQRPNQRKCIDKIPEEYTGSLKTYFSDLGLNRNNFYTDVSNYISYETGQPTHCYDETKMIGKLVFHEIDQEEEFETLLNKKITLSKKNAVFSINNNIINQK